MSMELERQVAKAVEVLNEDPQSCNRVAANHWLVEFQHTDAAWQVATSILTSSSSPSSSPSSSSFSLQVYLFAAQVLKRKIQNEGVCLQSEARAALQSALLLAARRFTQGPPALLTQICLALSALVLQSSEWKTPIEQLFVSLNNLQGQGNGSSAMLELLTVLPEEVMDEQPNGDAINAARRQQFSQELVAQTPAVIEFLMHQTEEKALESIQIHEKNCKILRCLLSWVRVGCFKEMPQNSLAAHPLLNFVFTCLQVAPSFDLAVEVLTELIGQNEGLPRALLSRVQSFKDGLLQPALASQNEKVICGLACLLAEIGHAAPELIAEATPEALALVDALLRCVSYPSEDCEIADSTLQFWSSLAGYLLGMDTERRSQKHATFGAFIPVFTTLLDALFLRVQVDIRELNAEEQEDVIDIPDGVAQLRTNMEELVIDICHLLGPTQFVQKLFTAPWTSLEAPIPWHDIEARLYALNVVADIVSQEAQPFDFTILMHLVMLLSNNSAGRLTGFMCLVQKAVAEVVGSYAKWICSFTDALIPLLLFLASGLSKPGSASAFAVAFRRVCEEAIAILSKPSNLDVLLWIGEGLDNMHLHLDEEEDIISAITLVLNSVGDHELMNKSLERLLKPSYEAIEVLLEQQNEGSMSQHAVCRQPSELAGRAFYRISAVFSQFSSIVLFSPIGDESVLLILAHFWPRLKRVFNSPYMHNSFLSAATCKALCQAIYASGRHFSHLLSEVVGSLSRNFLSYPRHDCFIRSATVIVEEYGHEEEYGPLFISVYQSFNIAETITALNSSYVCDQEPDLVEAYASFASTFVRCCSKELIAAAESLVEESFHKATICCSAMHRGASLAAMSFMSCFLDIVLSTVLETDDCIIEGSFSDMALRVCSRCGEGIISGVIYALLGVSAMTRVQKSSTLLQQLAAICTAVERTNRKHIICWTLLQVWLIRAVQGLPSEYLKPGEPETLPAAWMNAMESSAAESIESKKLKGGRANRTYMQGNGGRSLRLILRDFADTHRHTTPSFGLYPA